MAAFSLMLSRLSDQRRVAFFCLNHGRFTRRVADAYGMFVRSVPIVADVMPQTAIRQFVGSFRSQLTASVRHHCYPFSHFCRDLGVVPNVTFGFQSSQISEHTELDGELSTGVQLHQGRVKNSLGCMVYVVPGAYELRFDSSEAYYSMARLQMLARAFATCVKGICNGRNATLADLALTSTDEQRQIMELSQSAPTDYDPRQPGSKRQRRHHKLPRADCPCPGEGFEAGCTRHRKGHGGTTDGCAQPLVRGRRPCPMAAGSGIYARRTRRTRAAPTADDGRSRRKNG